MKPIDKPVPRAPTSFYGLLACALAVIGLVLPIPGFVELYNIPPGTECRPMMQAAAAFIFGLGTPFLVLPFAVVAFYLGRTNRILGLIGLALAMLPFPVYFFLFRWIVDAHALVLKP